MRIGSARVAALVLASLLAASPALARVVLVGVDGGSWNLLDSRMASGELPHLAALARRGVTGELASVRPVSSPTVWTSIATGREPGAHGIQSFYVTADDLRVPTVWERLAAQGLRVGLYDYLVTWPPRALPGGFVIPGWLRRDPATAPADVFERAGLTPYAYSLDGVRAPGEFLENCRRELLQKPERFVRLLERYDPDVAAVTFYSIDAASHRFWDDSFPEDFAPGKGKPDPRYREVVPEMLRGVDAAIGRIAASLGPDDTLLVASDHGFFAEPDGVRRVWQTEVDAWVERAGLLPERDGFEIASGFRFVIFRVLPGPFAEREATTVRLSELLESARSPTGEALFGVELLDRVERPAGAERPLAARLRQFAVRLFLWWRDVVFDQPAHAYVFGVPQGEVLDPLWPDGEVLLGGERLPIATLTHADDFSGTHDPTGIFLAGGRGVAQSSERLELSVLDLAALLFYLSDRPVPDDLDGTLPGRVLDPQHRAEHPPRRVAAADLPTLAAPVAAGPEPAGPGPEPAGDEAVTERLRSLGYVE